jgi:hypothetical protein
MSLPNSSSSNKISIDLADFDDQLYLIGNSIELMINGICSCLQDSNSLVQRTILEFINICLPLNSRQITKGDKLQLLVVAIHVLLRRDMTLNRRVYSWLIGPKAQTSSGINSENDGKSSSTNDKPEDVSENFFNKHSKHLLIAAIKMLLNKRDSIPILYLLNEESTSYRASGSINNSASKYATTSSSLQNSTSANTLKTLKILKIVSNLVERQEIGHAIIDEILLDLLFYVHRECNSLLLYSGVSGVNIKKSYQSSNLHQQNVKELNDLKKATSNFLFQSFQMYFIWDFCSKKFELACRSQYNLNLNSNQDENSQSHTATSPGQLCDLYEFILDLLTNAEIFNEIQTEHLPTMLNRVIQTLNANCSEMTNQDLSKSLFLCLNILKRVVPKIGISDTKQTEKLKRSGTSSKDPVAAASSSSSSQILEKDKVKEEEKSADSIVNDVINDIISLIESKDNPADFPFSPEK